jgi:glutathione S-transferase
MRCTPGATRFVTYDVALNRACAAYCRTILNWPAMIRWTAAARAAPMEAEELDMES